MDHDSYNSIHAGFPEVGCLGRILRISSRLFAGLLTLSFGAVAPAWADPGRVAAVFLPLSPSAAAFLFLLIRNLPIAYLISMFK